MEDFFTEEEEKVETTQRGSKITRKFTFQEKEIGLNKAVTSIDWSPS